MKKFFSIILILLSCLFLFSCQTCDHKWEETIDKKATCKVEGQKKLTCELCGKEKTEKIKIVSKHDWDKETVVEATCAKAGSKTKKCKICGETKKEKIAVSNNHSWGDETVVNATCAKAGSKTVTCKTCNKTKTEEIEILKEHNFTTVTEKEATCAANGMSKKTCNVCGLEEKQEIPKLAKHNYIYSITKPATCVEQGLARYDCSICGDYFTKAIETLKEHTYVEQVISNNNCTDNGSLLLTCSVCGDSFERTTYAYGHSWNEATCYSPKTCNNCGATEGAALGHDTSGSVCLRCGETISIDMTTRISAPSMCYFETNYVDGLELTWLAENISGKTINYYDVTLYFVNPVGDPAYDEITGNDYKIVKYVGPVTPGGSLIIYNTVGYSGACSQIIIGDIELKYSDGTSEFGWYGYNAYESY